MEFIGDFMDSSILRSFLSTASLWNWFRNVIVHLVFVCAKIRNISETSNYFFNFLIAVTRYKKKSLYLCGMNAAILLTFSHLKV